MTFYKVMTTFAPMLEVPSALWKVLLDHLRKEGAGTRESGAFLLGNKCGPKRVVTHFLPYEKLQPDALHDDYVSLSAASFSKLWKLCRSEGLSVVADIHTHRFGPAQSRSDAANPMIAINGHMAIIVPRFAQGPVQLHDLGLYIYKGNHRWKAYSKANVAKQIKLMEEAR